MQRCSFLIEDVQRGAERKQSCDTLNNLPEPASLVIRQWLSVATVSLTIAEPFL